MSDLLSTPQDLSQNTNCLDNKTSWPSSLWPRGPENGKNFASAYLQHGATHTLWLIVPPVLLAMGCFGNGMTIVVMRRMRASESTACLSVYFTALAVSDLFLLCTTVIWYWPEMAFDTPVSYFHDLSCTIPYFVSGTSSMTSSWVLMAMTSQRLTSVVVPLRVGVLCTVSRGKIITGSILIFACVTKMHVFFNNHVVVVDEEYKVCASIDEDVAYVHRMVDLFLVSVIPFLFLILANSVLICHVMQSSQFSRRMAQKNDLPNTTRSGKVSSMTTILILTSAAFLLLTLPFCILSVYLSRAGFYEGEVDDENLNQRLALAETVCVLLWTSNSAVNFYIYILGGSKFRQETKRCLCLPFRR